MATASTAGLPLQEGRSTQHPTPAPHAQKVRLQALKKAFETNSFETYEFQMQIGRDNVQVFCMCFMVEINQVIVLQWYLPNLIGTKLKGFFEAHFPKNNFDDSQKPQAPS